MNATRALTVAQHRHSGPQTIYLRQSPEIQTQDNVGRQPIQYELADHAREFRFRDANIINEGLGTSGDGIGAREFKSRLSRVQGQGRPSDVDQGVKIVSKRTVAAYAAGLLRHRRLSDRRPGPVVQ